MESGQHLLAASLRFEGWQPATPRVSIFKVRPEVIDQTLLLRLGRSETLACVSVHLLLQGFLSERLCRVIDVGLLFASRFPEYPFSAGKPAFLDAHGVSKSRGRRLAALLQQM